MKKIFTLTALFFIFSAFTRAQDPILVSDDTLKVGSSVMPALSVNIPEGDFENIQKNWIKKLESGTKSKVVEEDKELSIFGARIKSISENPLNIYSHVTRLDDGINLKTAFELKKDQYPDRSSGEYSKVKDYLFSFAKEQYLDIVNEQVKAEENRLRDLKRDLASLQRDQERMEKATRSNEEIIASERDRLEVLNNELESVSTTIIADSKEPVGMGAGEAKEDYVKDLEKKKKKTQREIEAAESKVSKAEKEIAEDERELPKNTESQNNLRQRIAEQEAVLKQFTEKLDNIKSFE